MNLEKIINHCHPDRSKIYHEAHVRPFPVLANQCEILQFTLLHEKMEQGEEYEHLISLVKLLDGKLVSDSRRAVCFETNELEIRWQRHVEFSSYFFLKKDCGRTPFSNNPLDLVPETWLKKIEGILVSSLRVAIQPLTMDPTNTQSIEEIFGHKELVSCSVKHGNGYIWSDFQLKDDGCEWILIQNGDLNPWQLGRLAQRVVELETYRIMALLVSPLIKDLGKKLDTIDFSLLLVSDHIIRIDSFEDQKLLLGKLSSLAADIELLRSTDYRFSASHAYFQLTLERLDEIQDGKIKGYFSFHGFLSRRILPVMRTADFTKQRISDISERVSNARELLQANINLKIEEQNQTLLMDMEKRSTLQLQLQEAVEGLSIAAISYYMVSLLKLIFGGLKTAGVPINKDLATGIAVPIVIFVVWYSINKIKEHVLKE
ncbi:MAG: DUF3422 domain-containing protein [SAR324 cluster bacterium]|nr:DUF3422 domain-containing protein [SAR324 cluster bacterium]